MVQRNGWMWISTGLVCIMIVASYSAVFYYMEYEKYQELYIETLNDLKKYEPYMFIHISIDYGNGTETWYNDTLVSIGLDLLNATSLIAKVHFTSGQWGAFVTHINDVGADPNMFWIYHLWNSTSSEWDYGLLAADTYILKEGEIFRWAYQKF